MSEFIVSARKYRPATFASVVGQQSITSTLKNAIERGQLAHAYLFCGPRGVGKTTCARIFAKAINCLNPNGAEACNECESCRAFNEGRSMNIHELDAASNNSVDDIRNLIEQVRILPQVGHYSLFIIDEVHMLSQQAFNAFLKTLEEPPKHAVFILATTEKHKIIPTILSRCQVYDFKRIRVEDSVKYLKYIADNEGVTCDEESLNLIAQKADGGMRDALSMFDKAVSFCNANLQYKQVAETLNVLDYDTYFTMTELLLAGDYTTALIRYDEVLAKGFSGQTFMAGLNQHMRDLLLAKGPAISLIELTGALLDRYREQAARCATEFLFGAISLLTEADGKIKQSSNQRLLVELGLMKIAGLGKKKNNDSDIAEAGLSTDEYPLPELPQNITPAAATITQGWKTAETVAPAPQPATIVGTVTTAATSAATSNTAVGEQVENPQQSPKPSQSLISEPVPSQNPVSEPRQTPSSASEPRQPQNPATEPKQQSSYIPPRRSALAGLSLSELLNSTSTLVEQAEEKKKSADEVVIDPKSEWKLNENRAKVVEEILRERPRFIVAFESMQVDGHVIKLEVPSQTLYEEIMRSKTEILMQMARTAGVEGMLDMQIVVNEQIKASRPIKLEDRIRHMTEKNPLLMELKKALDMEYE
ncbi:MAG: DNA polymerase III subunit gamma/tau [Alistipes sp.]|nr:DNA polymerase III subunit gamma/tau [Alistipes sp.]MBR6662172.1 DNA polymerase III subunit gamma/tau [Alistipes sp.]